MSLALGQGDDIQLFNKGRYLNGHRFDHFAGQLARRCYQGCVDQHASGIGPGKGFFILFPGFNAVINIGHDLSRKDHRHQLPHAGHKQGRYIQNIQCGIKVVLDAVNQRHAVDSGGGYCKEVSVAQELLFFLRV